VQALCKTSMSGISRHATSADTASVAIASARPNVGDYVYLDANAQRALPHLRRVDGTVVAIEGDAALLQLSSGGTLRVELNVLRLNRRRKRRPVTWEAP